MANGSPIRRSPGETLQQMIDWFAPACITAMLEILSPQVAAVATMLLGQPLNYLLKA